MTRPTYAPRLVRAGLPALFVVACAGLPLLASPAFAEWAAKCELPDPGDGVGEFSATDEDCCGDAEFVCNGTTGKSPALSGADPKLNIVLIVSDDHGYCHYSFMGGVCSAGDRVDKDCRSDIDCPDGYCVERRPGGSAEDEPLRLNDYTCRYRQPMGKGWCKDNPDKRGDRGGDKSALRFHHSNFPCSNTYVDRTNPTTLLEVEHPTARTPHIDALATQGAVFTRAHVGGNACKSSRPTIHFGKQHRHLKEVDNVADIPSIARWLEDDGGAVEPESERYRSTLLGKGENVRPLQGGYDSGIEGAKTRLAKFRCEDADDCQSATEYGGDPGNFPAIPYEARLGSVSSVEDMLLSIQGVGRAAFPDLSVIARNDAGGTCNADACEESGSTCEYCTSELSTPFFVWFAPNNPHKRGQGADFEGLYETPVPVGAKLLDKTTDGKWVKYAGHVTEFDMSVGAVVDELKRHCVCDGAGEKVSLWSQTVLMLLTDHGYFLPFAKNNPTENTHRTVIVINEPDHRKESGGTASRVIDSADFFGNSIDILKTVLDYGGVDYPVNPADPSDQTNEYPFARSLRPWVEGTETGADQRRVTYGESAKQGRGINGAEGRVHYMIIQQSEVGVCYDGTDPDPATGPIEYWRTSKTQTETEPHIKPCLSDDDCDSGGSCLGLPGSMSIGKRCINDPGKYCDDEDDCYPPCTGPNDAEHCEYDRADGSFGDRAWPKEDGGANPHADSAECSPTNGVSVDCAPSARIGGGGREAMTLCQPVLLKVVANGPLEDDGRMEITEAYDLLWDPDEQHNLLHASTGDDEYLGIESPIDELTTMKEVLTDCLQDYWHLSPGPDFVWTPKTWRTDPDPPSRCPDRWAEPLCGDDVLVSGAEDCEDGNLGGKSCADLPGFTGGTLGCYSATCEFDTSGCTS